MQLLKLVNLHVYLDSFKYLAHARAQYAWQLTFKLKITKKSTNDEIKLHETKNRHYEFTIFSLGSIEWHVAADNVLYSVRTKW